MKRFSTTALLFSAFVLALMVGCNPRKEVSKYSYLLKTESPVEPATPKEEVKKEEKEAPQRVAVSANTRKGVESVIKTAKSYLGTPYKYGHMDRKGTDCSGLTCNSYSSIGVKLPRSARDQSQYGQKIKRPAIEVGDLVFFSAYKNGKVDHVGLIVNIDGDEISFIHATVSKGVRYDRLDTGYWKDRFMIARRIGD